MEQANKFEMFSSASERIDSLSKKSGGKIILPEDMYDAKCIGVIYHKDVETIFDGVTSIKDQVTYIFNVKGDNCETQLKMECNVSTFETSNMVKLLERFNLKPNKFYMMLDKQCRLTIEVKTSKKGNDYNVIKKVNVPKEGQEIVKSDNISLPYWFGENADIIALSEGVSIRDNKIIDDEDENSDNKSEEQIKKERDELIKSLTE